MLGWARYFQNGREFQRVATVFSGFVSGHNFLTLLSRVATLGRSFLSEVYGISGAHGLLRILFISKAVPH